MTLFGVGGRSGISLIEIPVALVVLGLVIVMAAKTFSTAGHVQTDSRLVNQAAAIAASKITELEKTPLTLISDGEDQVKAVNGFGFVRKWKVTQPVSGSTAKCVQVEVHWQLQNQNESVQMATLIR
jgi:Tfp pilus assembly protein PilV